MKQLKWYFKHGMHYETFSVLYEDDKFMLVRNDQTSKYSFGMVKCFNTLYGFPVNWSCLHKEKAIDVLNGLIGVEQKHLPELGEYAETNIIRWRGMINALQHEKEIA